MSRPSALDERVPPPSGSEAGGLGLLAQRTYRYVRASIVGLLIALTVAVVYQSVSQHGLLASISAYYYTPAQAIFVGALVGLGVGMIALKGTTDVEDLLLNLGGMLAPVIAVVPTSRGADFRAAVAACRATDGSVLTDRASGGLDCPTVESLVAATRANVENNMVALVATGALALVATYVFAQIDRSRGTTGSAGRSAPRGKLGWGFAVAVALYLVAVVTFAVSTTWFINHAHYLAAGGLFLCIVAVVIANAVRKNRDADAGVTIPDLVKEQGRWYLALAVVMVLAGVILGGLVLAGVLTLFWLEAVLIALFAVFWIAQTWEQWDAAPGTGARGGQPGPQARKDDP